MDAQKGIYKKLTIHTIKEEVSGFKTLVFDDDHSITYQAGQYLTLVHFDKKNELRRSYSITSSPLLNEPLSIGVKRVANGAFSRILVDQAKAGDELITTGSGGFFVLPQDAQKHQQLFFFAAGSGITPVFSLLKTALYAYPQFSLVLIYSNASRDKAIFLESLQTLEKQYGKRFHMELLFSNAPDLSRARLSRELLLTLLEQYAYDKNKTLFYICGPESYMRLCTYTLQAAGVPADQIKKENFYFLDVAKRDAEPPDRQDHQVIVQLGKQTYSFTVPYPDSILKAARKQGIVLPYSCEAGRCGNCVARCTKGKVWHAYNEVLTAEELRQGLVLTCVGHPVGSDIELVIG
jgi:ferredoxin-NADP reductase